MNNRFTTDFLCSSSSFLSGMGSVISLNGNIFRYNTCSDPDRIAIAHDWHMVGQDISDSIKKAQNKASVSTRK